MTKYLEVDVPGCSRDCYVSYLRLLNRLIDLQVVYTIVTISERNGVHIIRLSAFVKL
jgi:hypothetical protein